MNSDPPSVRLSDDGELLDGKFCAHCGEISFARKRVCEHCGGSFPEQLSPMRLRLEALRSRDGKKLKSAEQQEWRYGEGYITAVFLTFVIVFLIYFVVLIFLN